jgi:hypothetical protein
MRGKKIERFKFQMIFSGYSLAGNRKLMILETADS